MINRSQKQCWYIALISVMIMGALSLAIVLALFIMGVDSSKSSLVYQQHAQAESYANACAEEVLEQIREGGSLPISGSETFDLGDCDYSAFGIGGGEIEINATGNVQSALHRLEIVITATSPTIEISQWLDVEDF